MRGTICTVTSTTSTTTAGTIARSMGRSVWSLVTFSVVTGSVISGSLSGFVAALRASSMRSFSSNRIGGIMAGLGSLWS